MKESMELMQLVDQICDANPDLRAVVSIVEGNSVSTYRIGNNRTIEMVSIHMMKLFVGAMKEASIPPEDIVALITGHVQGMVDDNGMIRPVVVN